jgi:hypothetical protein
MKKKKKGRKVGSGRGEVEGRHSQSNIEGRRYREER